jgi:integrase
MRALVHASAVRTPAARKSRCRLLDVELSVEVRRDESATAGDPLVEMWSLPGTKPRSDSTIEVALATVRDLARFLDSERGKHDWVLVDVSDIEAFLARQPSNRSREFIPMRQFFRFARTRNLLLVDPTKGVSAKQPKGFRGSTLTIAAQRGLFRRWVSDPAAQPHEALVGILAMLHGASSAEVRLLRLDHIDGAERTLQLGKRPHPVPLDPVSWATLQRCLQHRESLRTDNPHAIVTRGTRAGRRPSSTAYMSHVLDPAGLPPRQLRTTRDEVAFESAGMFEVELLQRLSSRKPRRPDTALAAVGLTCGDFALQTRHQELLMAPGLGPGPLSQAIHRLAQRRRLQRPGQEGDLGRQITHRLGCRGGAGGHHATPPSRPSIPSAAS